MMLARLLAIAIGIIPMLIMATIAKSITDAMLSAVSGISGMTTFETGMAMAVPYLILVYCAIYRPIVNFWQTLQGNNTQQPPPGGSPE